MRCDWLVSTAWLWLVKMVISCSCQIVLFRCTNICCDWLVSTAWQWQARIKEAISFFLLFLDLFLPQGYSRFPSLSWDFLLYFTMILQRIKIIVVDAGFEPGTSAPEVWCATNEPPHSRSYFYQSWNISTWHEGWTLYRKWRELKWTGEFNSRKRDTI